MPKQTKYAADKEVMLKRVLGRIDKHTSKGVSAPPRAAKAKKKAVTIQPVSRLKRNLRIVKRVRNVPVLGICEYCNTQFSGDPNMGNAQSAIQEQFNAHKCQRLDESQNAARIVREATEE
jgi:predicted nucleic acid binding AN1-type Zn finger protein